jgi:hypothetical protein
MNESPLDLSIDIDKQIREFAKTDVAPLIKVKRLPSKMTFSDLQQSGHFNGIRLIVIKGLSC